LQQPERCPSRHQMQTRTRTLDGTLRPMFECWYPGLANDNAAGTIKPPQPERPRDPHALDGHPSATTTVAETRTHACSPPGIRHGRLPLSHGKLCNTAREDPSVCGEPFMDFLDSQFKIVITTQTLARIFEAKNDNGCCSSTCHHTRAAVRRHLRHSGLDLDRGGCRPRRLERSMVGVGWQH
jgi:hypothetical protein